MNMKGGSIIFYTPKVPKNYSNWLIECNDSFIMIIILIIRSVHQIVWLHSNQTKLLAKYNNCILLPQVVVNCNASCSTMCGFMIRKLHKIASLRTHIYIYIYNANNFNFIWSGQPNISAFQFHVKNFFVLVKYKIEVLNLTHFSISYSHFSLPILSYSQ